MNVDDVIRLLNIYEGPAYKEPDHPCYGDPEFVATMERMSVAFDAAMGLTHQTPSEQEIVRRKDAEAARVRRSEWLASGTLWTAATPTRECGGMGDNYSALVIKTFGCYGSGNYPPVFRDLERALFWAKGTQYVIVPLKEVE